MSNLIGKKVYVFAPSGSVYSANYEWEVGEIIGAFVNGEVLVKYSRDKKTQVSLAEVAFTTDDDVPPKLSVKMSTVKSQGDDKGE